jgi:hypothetical protein
MSVNLECPYCSICILPISVAAEIDDLKGNFVHLAECPSCGEHFVVNTDEEDIGVSQVIELQPPGCKVKVSDHIPQNIRDDFIEAKICLRIGAIKAAATMSRRALQSSVVESGAPKDRLIKQLKWMSEHEIITKPIYNLAEQIRIIGNDAAHPSQDGIDEVKKEEVETIVSFLEKYLDHVYVTPKEIEESRKKSTLKT